MQRGRVQSSVSANCQLFDDYCGVADLQIGAFDGQGFVQPSPVWGGRIGGRAEQQQQEAAAAAAAGSSSSVGIINANGASDKIPAQTERRET